MKRFLRSTRNLKPITGVNLLTSNINYCMRRFQILRGGGREQGRKFEKTNIAKISAKREKREEKKIALNRRRKTKKKINDYTTRKYQRKKFKTPCEIVRVNLYCADGV